MSVQPIAFGSAAAAPSATPIKEPSAAAVVAVAAQQEVREADKVELSSEVSKASVYQKDTSAIARMRAEAKSQNTMLRRMAERLITEQYENGNELFQLLYGHKAVQLNPNIRVKKPELKTEAQVREYAQETAGDNGYYGVKQTSGRIIDFAKALSGGDISKIEPFRKAVENAFSDARVELGSPLPEITQSTYSAVMQGFDEWASQAASTAAPAAVPAASGA